MYDQATKSGPGSEFRIEMDRIEVPADLGVSLDVLAGQRERARCFLPNIKVYTALSIISIHSFFPKLLKVIYTILEVSRVNRRY
jgi:hypothetical protein